MEPVDEYLWIMIAMVVSFIISLFVFLMQRGSGLVASCNSLRSLHLLFFRGCCLECVVDS